MESQISLYNDPLLSKEKKLSILILVLLEIVFGNNNILYEKTVEYLINTNLIDPDTQSNDFLSTRTKLFNMIIKLNENLITQPVLNPTQLLTNSTNNSLELVKTHQFTSINIYNKTFNELEELGFGSFASVYKSQHKFDSMLYAIKKIIITDDLIDLGYDVFDEVKMLSKLSHPHVIRYYSSWVDFDLSHIIGSRISNNIDSNRSDSSNGSNGSDRQNLPILFIQTELCDYTLKEYIDTKISHDSIEQRFNLWVQMLQGVQYIHSQDIIHRDIKPSNIFFLNNSVKIGDFGLSKNISSFALQISKSVEIGCGYYRAPEVEYGDYDLTIDLYSLGVILLEMLINCTTIHERVLTIKSVLGCSLPIGSANLESHEYDELICTLTSSDSKERKKYTQYLK